MPQDSGLGYKNQRRVLEVRPGITDLASIEFMDENELLSRSDDPESTYVTTIMPTKLALNLDYVSRASLWFDISIIFRTLFKLVSPSRSAADRADTSSTS